MSQPSSTLSLLEQVDAIMNEEDADELFLTPSKRTASLPSSVSPLSRQPSTLATTPRKKPSRSKTLTPLSTVRSNPGSSAGPSSASLVPRASSDSAAHSAARSSYPTKWTKGHDEALIIFATSLPLLYRHHLYKMPFFEPWSGYGWSHLSRHLRTTMRRLLRDQGCDFEVPNISKSSSGGGALPDAVVRAMEGAIVRGSGGSNSPMTPVTPRRPNINTASRSPRSKQSSTRRRLKGAASPGLKSDEDDFPDLDSTASSAGLQTPPPPRASRPKRSSARKHPATSPLKGITSSDDGEEDSLCLGAKKRGRRRSPSTDSALDELWEPQTPVVDRSSKRRPEAQRSAGSSAGPAVKTPTRPSARPLVKTPTSSPARAPAREQSACQQQSVSAEAMCIDLTLSEDD